jgi:adenosylmethionine-8-amino-7-oxononanoate aminotransferase
MNWLDLDRQYCWHPFTQAQTARASLHVVRAKGAHVFDAEGRDYLDAVSSWWVNLHGHAHPVIAEAIAQQARTLEQVMFAGITHTPAIALAQALAQRLPAPLQYVFFVDNGSTAIEVALKMACQYWSNLNADKKGAAPRRRFLAFEGAYHGDTFGAMSTGKSSGFYGPFSDWLFDVHFLPYPATWIGHDPHEDEARSLAALDAYLALYGDTLVAFILEPLVQGAAGMRVARPAYVRAAVERVQSHGIPVIFDEVMTGFGRTGTMFAAEQVGVTPDILCLSKGLTGGFLPMGATVAQPHIYEAFLHQDVDRALLHGHSYTANPLGCAAALASLGLFESEHTMERIARIAQTHARLLGELSRHPAVRAPRQAGTIAAFDIATNESGQYGASVGQWLRERLRDQGVLLRPLGSTAYLIPPYCITDGELESIYCLLRDALDAWQAQGLVAASTDYF